jgi:hypothetical protein
MAGGLLKHHCTCVSCPLYLVDLRTPKDRILGTRHGMFRHLKHFLIGHRDYWPGLHVSCFAAFQRYVKPFANKKQQEEQIRKGKEFVMAEYEHKKSGSKDNLKLTIGIIFDQLLQQL